MSEDHYVTFPEYGPEPDEDDAFSKQLMSIEKLIDESSPPHLQHAQSETRDFSLANQAAYYPTSHPSSTHPQINVG